MSITAVSPSRPVAPRAHEQRHEAAVVPKMPDIPKPVTPTTAAGYLMQVPSSRVLEALASLQRAMGQQATQGNEAPAHAAQRLAKAVAPPPASVGVNEEA
jgi:hypothetical protein